jgi:hypothetical protein
MNEFEAEHKKRDARITEEQRRAWADDMLKRLRDSIAYQKKCTPQARMAEEKELLKLYADWERRDATNQRENSSSDD